MTEEKKTAATADENESSAALVPYVGGGELDAKAWADTAITRLHAAKNDHVRLGIQDEALRVVSFAVALGDLDAQVLAWEFVQRVHRAIGQAHPRQPGGRPASAARDAKNLPTDEKVLSASTVHRYRAVAEALSDDGFERVARAARDARQPLKRATVHRAGELEAEGADPADAVRQRAETEATRQTAGVAERSKGSSPLSVPADAAAAHLHVCSAEALCEEVAAESIDAVVTALHRVRPSRRQVFWDLLEFAEHAVRAGGLLLVGCPGRALADVIRWLAEPDKEGNVALKYSSLLAGVETGDNKGDWFPVLVFRKKGSDAQSARRRSTLFQADTSTDAWRQIVRAWLQAGSDVADPYCGSGACW